MEKNSCSRDIHASSDQNQNVYSENQINKENLDTNYTKLETVEKSMKRKKGMNWTEKETNYFIQLCIEKRILKLMDGKKYKHIDIYKSLEPDMKEAGFIKTGEQMKMKMKHLKEMYYKCKRNNSISGHDRMTFLHFEAMDELLGSRLSAKTTDVGIESSTSQSEEFVEVEILQRTDDDAKELNVKDVLVDIQDLPSNVSKKKKTQGRLSNVKRAEQFSEMFVEKQTEMFTGLFKVQDELHIKFQKEMLKAQMEEMKTWETEIMKQEQEHQIKLMDGFLKGLQMIQQQQHVPSFYPTVQFPGSSAYSSQIPSFMHNPPSSAFSCNSNLSMSPQTSTYFVPSASQIETRDDQILSHHDLQMLSEM